MAKLKQGTLTPRLMQHPQPPTAGSETERPIAQTVKLDKSLFRRLKMMSADTRKTQNDILVEALTEYLEKRGT